MPERWSACSRALKQYDENMIRNWKEDIDTVLVFVSTRTNPESITLMIYYAGGSLFSCTHCVRRGTL